MRDAGNDLALSLRSLVGGRAPSLFWQEIAGGEHARERWIGETDVTAVMVERQRRWRWRGEIDWPPRRLTEEPLNGDNAFIIAALSFIPRAGGGPLALRYSFYTFFAAKDPLSSSCRWVPRQPVGINVSARQGLGDGWVL